MGISRNIARMCCAAWRLARGSDGSAAGEPTDMAMLDDADTLGPPESFEEEAVAPQYGDPVGDLDGEVSGMRQCLVPVVWHNSRSPSSKLPSSSTDGRLLVSFTRTHRRRA